MALRMYLIFVKNGTEPEGFPKEATRHAYPIVEDTEGQDESVQRAIAAVREAVNQGKKSIFPLLRWKKTVRVQ
ncbi:hypothetical protein GCM10020331_093410 [Ectobacillus funiculus]